MTQNSNHTTASSFNTIRKLLLAYTVVAWLGFVATILLSATVAKNHPDAVSTTTWIHSMIVALTGIPFVRIAERAAQRNGRAVLRLRIVLTIVPIAFIADIFLLSLPAWMDVVQVLCALLLTAASAAYFTHSK